MGGTLVSEGLFLQHEKRMLVVVLSLRGQHSPVVVAKEQRESLHAVHAVEVELDVALVEVGRGLQAEEEKAARL